MNSRENRFSVIFSSGLGLAITITLFVLLGMDLITMIATMSNMYAGAGVFAFIKLIGEIPLILVAIGFLLSYLSGKKSEINPSGLMLVRVSVMITGICKFIVMAILAIIVFIASVIGVFGASEFTNGLITVLAAFLGLVVTALVVFIAAMNLVYALKVNKSLAIIRFFEEVHVKIVGTAMKLALVLFIIGQGISLISTIVSIASPAILDSLMQANGLGYVYDYMYGSSSMTIIEIFSILSIIAAIAVYVMVYMLIGKAERFSNVGQKKVEAPVTESNVNQPPVSEPKPSEDMYSEENTMQLDAQPQQEEDQNTVMLQENVNQPVVKNNGVCGHIIALSGAEKGYSYPIKDGEELIIGKDPKVAHIVVSATHERISKKHCGIKYDSQNDKYLVIDYSTNGTFINSIRKLTKGLFISVPKGTIINLAKDNIDFKLD